MEDCQIRREDILKLKICKENPEGVEPETSEASSDDATSDEEVDIITYSDNEELDCESNASKESNASQKLRSTSSCSSLTVHVCSYEGCDKFFSRPSRLDQHKRTHTGERPFVCPSECCSKSYARQQHLKRHIEISHQDGKTEEKLKCEMCGKMMSSAYNLRKHVHRFHIRKKHECSECEQSFLKQSHLQKHTYVHTGIKPFPCDYPGCKMRCMAQSKLKLHKLTHQKSRYICPQESCQQKFDLYKDLQHHITTDHPKVCDICSRPFRQLRSLKKHRLTHENTVEAYFCTYPACDKHYFQLNNLKTHIKDKHQQQKIYHCGVCEKRLSTKQKLIQHMTTHNPTYKRNYVSKKPRKLRKDKGSSRRDFAKLLSGYPSNGEDDSMTQTMQPETISKKNTDVSSNVDATLNPLSEERSTRFRGDLMI